LILGYHFYLECLIKSQIQYGNYSDFNIFLSITGDMKSIVYYQRLVFGAIFIGYSLYVLCRKSFSFVIPYVQAEEKLSKEDLGMYLDILNR